MFKKQKNQTVLPEQMNRRPRSGNNVCQTGMALTKQTNCLIGVHPARMYIDARHPTPMGIFVDSNDQVESPALLHNNNQHCKCPLPEQNLES